MSNKHTDQQNPHNAEAVKEEAVNRSKLENVGKYGAIAPPADSKATGVMLNKGIVDRFGLGKLPKEYINLSDKRFTKRERIDALGWRGKGLLAVLIFGVVGKAGMALTTFTWNQQFGLGIIALCVCMMLMPSKWFR